MFCIGGEILNNVRFYYFLRGCALETAEVNPKWVTHLPLKCDYLAGQCPGCEGKNFLCKLQQN